jgi:hypothetical protein
VTEVGILTRGWGQVLGTGSRFPGAVQAAPRQDVSRLRTSQIAGKARYQARFPHRRNRRSKPPSYDGWEARALLAAAGALYFATAEFAPFDRADAWVDARFFWEPIVVALIALLLVLVITSRYERRQLLARQDAATSAEPSSELIPICVHCKAVCEMDDTWEPIEGYLANRTTDKFTRSLCPACLERLAS